LRGRGRWGVFQPHATLLVPPDEDGRGLGRWGWLGGFPVGHCSDGPVASAARPSGGGGAVHWHRKMKEPTLWCGLSWQPNWHSHTGGPAGTIVRPAGGGRVGWVHRRPPLPRVARGWGTPGGALLGPDPAGGGGKSEVSLSQGCLLIRLRDLLRDGRAQSPSVGEQYPEVACARGVPSTGLIRVVSGADKVGAPVAS